MKNFENNLKMPSIWCQNGSDGPRATQIGKKKSVENAGVAFVKGADERNKFFGKNKQSVMHDEHVRANKAKG